MAGESGGPAQLLCGLLLLLATAAALAGAAIVDERPPTTAARSGDFGAEPGAIAELGAELTPEVARRVEELRGVEFDEVPLPRVVDAAFLNDFNETEFRRREGDPVEALADDEAVARILGLLGTGEDLLGFVEGAGELAAAAWDTRSDDLYLVADATTTPALIEFFLAHELTHALEDERFGLPDPGSDDADRALARTALVEGTATALMSRYAEVHLSAFALAVSALELDPGTTGFPGYAVEQLEWAYLGGSRFVERLYRLGGGWGLIDNALAHRPPASTAQVLHPLLYLRDQRPVEVEVDAGPLRRAGWELEDSGTVGELATAQLLALGAPRPIAERAAAGWSGDRYELWSRDVPAVECAHPCREDLALVIGWRWADAAEATEFAGTVAGYLEEGLGGRRSDRGAWALDGGWAALGVAGDAAMLAFAPGERLAAALAVTGARRASSGSGQ